jgi:hypothetical protein
VCVMCYLHVCVVCVYIICECVICMCLKRDYSSPDWIIEMI